MTWSGRRGAETGISESEVSWIGGDLDEEMGRGLTRIQLVISEPTAA